MIVKKEARITQRKPCSIATFSTINLMWITLDSNPSLRRERSANACVSHGTAQTYHNPHRDWNNFVFPRAFLGWLTLKMKVLGPSVTSVTIYQFSGRGIPAEVLNLILFSYVQGRFFEQNGPKPSHFPVTFYFLPCFMYKTYIVRHFLRLSFYPKILCALLWRALTLYVSFSFIISQHENVFGAISLKCMYCLIFHHKSRSIITYTHSYLKLLISMHQ